MANRVWTRRRGMMEDFEAGLGGCLLHRRLLMQAYYQSMIYQQHRSGNLMGAMT
jgi:hypothetical protein